MSEVTWQDVDVYMHMSVCHQTQRLLHAVKRSSTTSSSWRSRKVSLAFFLHFDIAIQYPSHPCLSIRFSPPYGIYLFVACFSAFFFLLLRLLCFASVGVLRCFKLRCNCYFALVVIAVFLCFYSVQMFCFAFVATAVLLWFFTILALFCFYAAVALFLLSLLFLHCFYETLSLFCCYAAAALFCCYAAVALFCCYGTAALFCFYAAVAFVLLLLLFFFAHVDNIILYFSNY